jgi:outer membrane PBP1 activator LpoA protein
MTRLLIIIVLSLTLFSCNNKAKQELLINETELPTEQADTTESRLDQQSDDPNTNSANSYKKTQKSLKIENYVFTLFKCRHACLF